MTVILHSFDQHEIQIRNIKITLQQDPTGILNVYKTNSWKNNRKREEILDISLSYIQKQQCHSDIFHVVTTYGDLI